MRRSFTTAALLVVGCDVPNLDFQRDATAITALGKDDASTAVSICAGPSGLLDCNEDTHAFDVTYGAERAQAVAVPLSFGVLAAAFDSNDADRPVTITRDDGAIGGGTMPEPFELESPETGTSVARGSHVHLVWERTAVDRMAWSGTVTCGTTTRSSEIVVVRDTGVLVVPIDELPLRGSTPCTASIAVVRERDGSMADRFGAGSTFVARQRRTLEFQLAP